MNSFSQDPIVFEDQRDYAITFSAASNVSINITEDQNFSIPAGITLQSVISNPSNIVYTVDAGHLDGVVFSWVFPDNINNPFSITEPTPNKYVLSGNIDSTVWPNILPEMLVKDQGSDFSFVSTVTFANVADPSTSDTLSWNTNVVVTDIHEELSAATNFVWDEDIAFVLPGVPQITDTYIGPGNYILSVTPNVSNSILTMSSTGSAQSSFDSTTKKLTLVGDRAQVNQALGNIFVVPFPDADQSYSISYSLTNPISNLVTQVTQLANIGNIDTDVSFQATYTYVEDGSVRLIFESEDNDSTIGSVILVAEQTSGPPGVFQISGASAGPGNVGELVVSSISQFNSANVTFNPAPDTGNTVDIVLNAFKINDTGNIQILSNAAVVVTNTSTEINFSFDNTYDYTEDTPFGLVFAVSDTDTQASDYTVTFVDTTVPQGTFSVNGTFSGLGNPGVFTGSRTAVNQANIVYAPAADHSGPVSLDFSLSKTHTLFGTVVMANSLPITVTNTASDSEFDFVSNSYRPNSIDPLNFEITDFAEGSTYTVKIQDMTTPAGLFLHQGIWQQNNTFEFTGSKQDVNNLDIKYLPFPGYQGTVDLLYSQTKSGANIPVPIVHAANTAVSLTPAPQIAFAVDAVRQGTPRVNAAAEKVGPFLVDKSPVLDIRIGPSDSAQSAQDRRVAYIDQWFDDDTADLGGDTTYRFSFDQISPVPTGDPSNTGVFVFRAGTQGAQAIPQIPGIFFGNTGVQSGNRATFTGTTAGNFVFPDFQPRDYYLPDGTVISPLPNAAFLSFTGDFTPRATGPIQYFPPLDFSGNVVIQFSVERDSIFGVPGTGNTTVITRELATDQTCVAEFNYPVFPTQFSFQQVYNFSPGQLVNLTQTLFGSGVQYAELAQYRVTFSQLSPDPAEFTPGWLTNSGAFVAPGVEVTQASISIPNNIDPNGEILFDTAQNINVFTVQGNSLKYRAPSNFTGNVITIGYTMTKILTEPGHPYGGTPHVVADNLVITLNKQ